MEELLAEWKRQATSPEVQAALGGHDYEVLQIVGARPVAKPGDAVEPSNAFHALVFDYTTNTSLLVDSQMGQAAPSKISPGPAHPFPRASEYARAQTILRETPLFGSAIRDNLLHVSGLMPGLVPGASQRSVLFWMDPTAQGREYGIPRGAAGVELGTRSLLQSNRQATPASEVTSPEVGMLSRSLTTCDAPPESWTPYVPLTELQRDVTWGDWSFIVVRPAASQPNETYVPGSDGGGVELRSVMWKGRLVLTQAHVPIVNVKYNSVPCSYDGDPSNQRTSFRDYVAGEHAFTTEVGGTGNSGIFWGYGKPTTMWSVPPTDEGNFEGVYMWVEGNALYLASVLKSGHYRYLSKWAFYTNGMLRPEFGFAAVQNPCTCNSHTHHAYWRLDLDVNGGAGNTLSKTTNNGSSWSTFGGGKEARDYRALPGGSYGNYYYRVTESGGYKVLLKPSTYDGSTASNNPNPNFRQAGYADGDVWGLAYKGNELYDVDPPAEPTDESTKAHIQKWVTGDSVSNTDVVVWYGGHMTHAGSEHSSPTETVGPTIIAAW